MKAQQSLVQQGYDYSPEELNSLSWGLRFTPSICMVGAVTGLVTQQAWIHFSLAALGILPFWFPAGHPVDFLYNRLLRPLWNGMKLPPNPLPRRIACLMGGAMNVLIGISFLRGAVAWAYGFGAILITLQLVVITSHFCVASWMYQGLLKLIGWWIPPNSLEEIRQERDLGAIFVDVREPQEFVDRHIEGAINVPLGSLPGRLEEFRNQTLIFYCRSGICSQEACRILAEHGGSKALNLGGISRWREN